MIRITGCSFPVTADSVPEEKTPISQFFHTILMTRLQSLTRSPEANRFFWIGSGEGSKLWEPFSDRQSGIYNCSRHLYKSLYGNKVIFEEINHDIGLTYRYQWCSSHQFGFIRRSYLLNNTSSDIEVKLVDGIQNILPYGVTADTQNASSNLVDAYKKK